MYEFYSSLKVKTNNRNNILDFTMEFRLKGERCVVTHGILAKWLNCDCKGIFNALSKFSSNGAWVDLGGCEVYDAHMSISTKLGSSMLRMFYRIISYMLNAWNDLTSKSQSKIWYCYTIL